MIDELGLCRSVAPNLCLLYILGYKFVSTSFRPRLVLHIPSFYLFWPDTVLLSQPFLEAEPDISVELMEGFCWVDCPVVIGPSPNNRIHGLEFVGVFIVEGAPCGHRFDLCLNPLQTLFRWSH